MFILSLVLCGPTPRICGPSGGSGPGRSLTPRSSVPELRLLCGDMATAESSLQSVQPLLGFRLVERKSDRGCCWVYAMRLSLAARQDSQRGQSLGGLLLLPGLAAGVHSSPPGWSDGLVSPGCVSSSEGGCLPGAEREFRLNRWKGLFKLHSVEFRSERWPSGGSVPFQEFI